MLESELLDLSFGLSWRQDAITGSMTCIKVGDKVEVDAWRRDLVLPDLLFDRDASEGIVGNSAPCACLSSKQGGDDGCTVEQSVMPSRECASALLLFVFGECISRNDTDIDRDREDEKRDAERLVLFPPVVVREP